MAHSLSPLLGASLTLLERLILTTQLQLETPQLSYPPTDHPSHSPYEVYLWLDCSSQHLPPSVTFITSPQKPCEDRNIVYYSPNPWNRA